MSWSFGFVSKGTLTDYNQQSMAAVTAYVDGQASLDNAVEPTTQEQIDAAVEAGRAIVKSKAVGPQEATFNVTLSGHANPDHAPREGFANDQVTVSVYQVT